MFCNGIARWTGVTWETLKEFKKVNLDFSDMEVYHNKLYMLGNFDDYDSGTNSFTYVSGFFQYDGITLKHFNVGDRLVSRGSSLEVFNDTLFISGKFDSLSYVPAKRLVKFVDGTFSTYAPVTTKWWYNSSAEGQQQPNSCYKYYEVTRDTFVMNTPPTSGYNCRKIKAEQYLPNKTHTALQPLYVFGDTNRIMYYNNYQKRFVTGYKFNVKDGDTLTYYTPQPQSTGDTTFRVVVDSVTTLTVQTEKLKRVYTTPLDGWSFGNDGYAQLIGGLASMLPQPISYFTNEGPLLCYQDTSIYFKYFTGGISCDVLTAIVEEQKQKEIFSISPNPVKESITVTSKENIQGIELFSILGTQLIEQSYSSSQKEIVFHTKDLPSGIYFLRVKLKNGWQVGKLVKE